MGEQLTVGRLRGVLEGLPDDMVVLIDDGYEQSMGQFAVTASVQTVQDGTDEEYPVGYPHWMGEDTPEYEALWISQWEWRE